MYIYRLEEKVYGINELITKRFASKESLENFVLDYLTDKNFNLEQIFEIIDNMEVVIEYFNYQKTINFNEFCNIKEFKKKINQRYDSIRKCLEIIDKYNKSRKK